MQTIKQGLFITKSFSDKREITALKDIEGDVKYILCTPKNSTPLSVKKYCEDNGIDIINEFYPNDKLQYKIATLKQTNLWDQKSFNKITPELVAFINENVSSATMLEHFYNDLYKGINIVFMTLAGEESKTCDIRYIVGKLISKKGINTILN